MKRTFAIILAALAAVALFGGLVYAVLVAAHVSESAATTVYGLTPLHFESSVICAHAYFHFVLPCSAIWLFAAATMLSASKPNFFNSCLRGADAPNVSMQML